MRKGLFNLLNWYKRKSSFLRTTESTTTCPTSSREHWGTCKSKGKWALVEISTILESKVLRNKNSQQFRWPTESKSKVQTCLNYSFQRCSHSYIENTAKEQRLVCCFLVLLFFVFSIDYTDFVVFIILEQYLVSALHQMLS